MPVVHADVVERPLDAAALVALVDTPRAGAVATFVGRIRDHDPEASGEVVALDYTAHPDAPRLIGEIARAVAAEVDADGEALVALEHRIGAGLGVGELAIVVAVSSPHRRRAFALCEALVERVKVELPVWKHQHEASGRATWSNLGLDA